MTDWIRRFQQFVARKEAEAVASEIPPFSTEVDQPNRDVVAIGNSWSRTLFDGPWYMSRETSGELPSTSLVFVQSRNGNTGAKNPATLGGGTADSHLIYEGLSRVAADAVMSGAETVRGGRLMFSVWHPELVALRAELGLPRHPIQIVATLRGLEFDDSLILNVPELRVVVLTIAPCSAVMHHALAPRPWITPVLMKDARDLAGAFHQLHRLGVRRISCIGGRTIARQLIDARLIHDMYLTTSPKEGGEPNTPMYPKPLTGELVVRKRGTGRDAGVEFEHRTHLRPS